jgi:hypothetical protein
VNRLSIKRFSGSWRWLWLLALLVAPVLWLNREAAAEPETPAAIQAWDEPVLFSTTSTTNGAYLPVIGLAPNGTLLVAYNHRIGTINNPYYRLRPPGGLVFTPPAPIHVAAVDSTQVQFAFDNNSAAHAVWRTATTVEYAHQSVWPSNGYETVTASGQLIRDPHIDVGGNGHIHVVWTQGENPQAVYYSFSTNNGNNWSTPQQISASDAARNAIVPKVAVDANNTVHVVWEARIFDVGLLDFRWQIEYRTATWNGAAYTWSALPATVLSSGVQDVRPALTAVGNELHLSYTQQVTLKKGSPEQSVYYRRYTPGDGWSAPANATGGLPLKVNTNSPFYLVSTITACDADDIHIFFHGALEENGQEQILGSSSAQGWTVRDFVTDGFSRDVNPSATCDDGQLHVVYERIFVANQLHQVYYVTGAPEGLFLPFIRR